MELYGPYQIFLCLCLFVDRLNYFGAGIDSSPSCSFVVFMLPFGDGTKLPIHNILTFRLKTTPFFHKLEGAHVHRSSSNPSHMFSNYQCVSDDMLLGDSKLISWMIPSPD